MLGWSPFLSTFSTNTTGQLDILGHNCNPLGMDSAQVGVFKETDQVRFAGLLQVLKKNIGKNAKKIHQGRWQEDGCVAMLHQPHPFILLVLPEGLRWRRSENGDQF